MAIQIKTRIKNRQDSVQAWRQANPILLQGEIAAETENGGVRFKVGDGTTRYNDLPYAGGSQVSVDGTVSDFGVLHISKDEYARRLIDGSLLSNELYVISSDYADMYGEQIKNIAPGTELSDAVNLEQLSGKADLSALGGFYAKSETSSAAEISAAVSGVERAVLYEEDVNGNYTAVTIGSRNAGYEIGQNSFVQGIDCVADDENAHAQGWAAHAGGSFSHAEGVCTSAYGDSSHAEGTRTLAGCVGSHAEGIFTRADGPMSHVEGIKAVSELSDSLSFVWQGAGLSSYDSDEDTGPAQPAEYKAHGPGTFNINPVNGLSGVYVGELTLAQALKAAGGGASRYALETAALVASDGSLTCTVNDRTITTIQVSSSSTPVVVQLPPAPEDGARDFILRIEISSSTAPTFTFSGVDETIDFDSEDDDWAVMEPGLNLVSFTETKRGN